MSARDGAERLLDLATMRLPAYRAEWGQAMLSELASIDNADARRQFARSAARAAFGRGLGMTIGFGLGAGLLVAALVLVASRLQLADGGPGIAGKRRILCPKHRSVGQVFQFCRRRR